MKFAWKGIILLTVGLCLFQAVSKADEIQIPFAVNMDGFKEDCKVNGLDLSGQNDSDGFVTDKASNFSVFTYSHIDGNQMQIIQDATWKNLRKPHAKR